MPCLPSLGKVFSIQGKDQDWGQHGASSPFSSPQKSQCTTAWRNPCHLRSWLLAVFFPTVVPHPHPPLPPSIPQFLLLTCSPAECHFPAEQMSLGGTEGSAGSYPWSQNAMVLRAETVGKDPISVSALTLSAWGLGQVTSLNFSVFICKITIMPALWAGQVPFCCK